MRQKIKNELNEYFENVTFDYYNVKMAMILSFWKHNFEPLDQDEIYTDIISDESHKDKLCKPDGQKFTRILSEIQRIFACETNLYKLFVQDDHKNKNINF